MSKNARRRPSVKQFDVPSDYPGPGPLGQTDPNLWRLDSSDAGRHVWHYFGKEGGQSSLTKPCVLKDEAPQNFETKHWLGLPTGAPVLQDPAGDPMQSARNGYSYYKQMQSPDGHWSGEYGGMPTQFTESPFADIARPSLSTASLYVMKEPIPEEWRIEMARYIYHKQRNNGSKDSGWGLHIEGCSTVFGTATNYVALRLLGVHKDDPMMIKARETLLNLGGAAAAPAWGKMWLSILNCYSWEGMNCTPAEMLLLPEWTPVHPWRYWIHMRSVYFPLSFLYGRRFQAKLDPLIRSIRTEIYNQPYDTINWSAQRNNVAKVDLYTEHPFFLDVAFGVLAGYENYIKPCMPYFRNKGLERAYELVVMDDENTSFQALAPVNKPLNMLCRWFVEGGDSKAVAMHKTKLRDFLWMSRDGMMMCGTNGSQLWDCVFITQALVESGLAEEKENHHSVLKALEWLADCQIQQNPPHLERAYRHPTKGAWPFSTREQGYTVSDCTAEGLKSVIMLQLLSYTPDDEVPEHRLQEAVDILLGLQNSDGGFASYEKVRGSPLLEALNPAEVFGRIMIEYNYPECTTACLTALSLFQKHYPGYRSAEIEKTRQGAIEYIHKSQRPDGSWYGSWGICFTYATMFAVESLVSAGETYTSSERIVKACEFLLQRQMADGGWGESFKSCERAEYVHNLTSQLTNTSWVVITLCTARYPHAKPIRQGVDLIMSRQQPDGHWPREAVEGIFNKTCAISYPNFLYSWTIYALGKAFHYLKTIE